MYVFLHGYMWEDVMSEPQQPRGVQEKASLRTKANMPWTTEQKGRKGRKLLNVCALLLNKSVFDPENFGFLGSISHYLSHV